MTPIERKTFMTTYLKMKVEEEDWHGVADAAMDLREIEVELRLQPMTARCLHLKAAAGVCPDCLEKAQPGQLVFY